MIGRRSHDDAQAFDQACNGRAPRDSDIAGLVRVAEELCAAAADIEPSTDFRDSLRTRLMSEAATVLVASRAAERSAVTTPAARPARRRVATLTAAVVASAGTVGIVASSASALPGEMLYPVKRTVETVELKLQRDDSSRGAFQLTQATERLEEARLLNADGRSIDLVTDTLDDFSSAAVDGSSKLFDDFTASGHEKSIRQVNDFAASSSLDLSELSAGLPDDAAASLTAASRAVTDLAAQASVLCGSCDPADVRALADAAAPATRATPAPAAKTRAAPADEPAPKPTKAPAAVPQPASSPAAPAPAPVATTPAPAKTTRPPVLSGITDPLLGGLLGDEEQVGLVPGLLGGLLGAKPKP